MVCVVYNGLKSLGDLYSVGSIVCPREPGEGDGDEFSFGGEEEVMDQQQQLEQEEEHGEGGSEDGGEGAIPEVRASHLACYYAMDGRSSPSPHPPTQRTRHTHTIPSTKYAAYLHLFFV